MSANKKAAFLIYPMFCNYEIALTLSSLEMEGKEIVVFAKDKSPVKCEEDLSILPDKSLDEFIIDEYDCILFKEDTMEKIELKVAGMSCAHCEKAIVNALEDLGAATVHADAKAGTVSIEFDQNILTIESIKNEILEIGYELV